MNKFKDEQGQEFTIEPAALTEISERQHVNNVRGQYPNAVYLTDQGRQIKVEDAYKYVDDGEKVYFILGFVRKNIHPTLWQRFKRWVTFGILQ